LNYIYRPLLLPKNSIKIFTELFHYKRGVKKMNQNTTVRGRPVLAGRDSAAMEIYCKQVGTLPLLSGEEESHITETIRSLREKIKQFGDAYTEERACLEKKLNRERNKMIRSNLRLVIKLAKLYQGRGLGLDDLISEGNIGLIIAVDRFDPSRGCRFSTYAGFWIRQAIVDSLAERGSLIRFPKCVYETIRKRSYAINALQAVLGRTPTEKEIAEYTGISVSKIHRVTFLGMGVSSLDTPAGEMDGQWAGSLEDFVKDEKREGPMEKADNAILREKLDCMFDRCLTKREQFVLAKRFGLEGRQSHSLESLGKMLHVSRERARQIQNRALEKMRGSKGFGKWL
jgi:RNA polymerase primary sigma factor